MGIIINLRVTMISVSRCGPLVGFAGGQEMGGAGSRAEKAERAGIFWLGRDEGVEIG